MPRRNNHRDTWAQQIDWAQQVDPDGERRWEPASLDPLISRVAERSAKGGYVSHLEWDRLGKRLARKHELSRDAAAFAIETSVQSHSLLLALGVA